MYGICILFADAVMHYEQILQGSGDFDDEFITRQGIKHMLLWEQEGFQIVGEASNGQEGLEMIEKYQPEIVLADIVMPVLNGIDFSLILQEKYPDIKLIILSSYDNFEYVRTTLLNGAVDYVLKPTLNPEILLRALKKAARGIPGFQLDRKEKIDVSTQLERYLTGYSETLEEEGLKNCFPYLNCRILAADMKKACKNNRRQMEQLQEFVQEYYGIGKAGYYWATQDCMSLDGIPYIGEYSRNTPGLYVASGFGKWGMTTSMAAAHILTEMICGRETGWEAVFDPLRSIWKPQLFVNTLEALAGLLTPTMKRCPHMGCALKWNPQEHTWDCSCHGSRFEEDGKLINNPAAGDANVAK